METIFPGDGAKEKRSLPVCVRIVVHFLKKNSNIKR